MNNTETPLAAPEMVDAVQALLDKQALHENMMLYIRAQDRKDLETVVSTYWPDATDDHGRFVGLGRDFCEEAFEHHKTTGHRALHHCGNVLIDLLGDQAKRETVFMYVRVESERTILLGGRYRDLCEKRDSEWKVLRRLVIFDWVQTLPADGDYGALFGYTATTAYGSTYPDDPIYQDWSVLARMEDPEHGDNNVRRGLR